ncbi:MAG TPA: hypothetical protein VMB50_11500 [Myxococcales bacterium]|nr:hypothetical protein [Myxococcales bacterium]
MTRISVAATLVVTATLLASRPARAAEKRLRLAVLALKAEGVENSVAETVADTLTADLGRGGRYDVIGRSEIEAMAGFQSQRMKLGCSGDTACLAEIGGALGVDRLVFGSLGRVGGLYVLNTRLLEISRVRVIARDTETVSSADGLIAAAQRASQVLLGELPAPLSATSTAEVPTAGGLRHTAWPWAMLAAGAVAGGVGAYFGVATNDQHNVNQDVAQSTAARSAAATTGQTDQIAADSLFGAALVLGLVGVGMLVFGGGGG